MPKISIIAAVADNYAIGMANKMPWHLPADLKHFREITTGHCIVMGRNTFESLSNKPLPNRKNIVLSSTISKDSENRFFKANSIEEVATLCEKEEQLFIIGGAAVYRQFINKADSMYITWIHAEFEADTFFPSINFEEWKEISRENYEADEKNPYDYSFVYYEREISKCCNKQTSAL